MPQIDEQKLRARIASAMLLNGWQINEVLGRGKHSVVFDVSRNTPAGEEHSALKAICEYPSAEELANYEAMGMTAEGIKSLYADRAEADQREIRAMRQMQGEAFLVTYYDFDIVKTEDVPGEIILIRMEKLTPLKAHLRFTPLTEKRVASIAMCTAKALSACHGLQPTALVHGDVKPDNLYHFKGDVYKLGDFGISNAEGSGGVTLPAGTPYYMAPECALMRATPLSDIYSLGKTMLYLLGAGEVSNVERPAACRSDSLWELIRQMTSEDPADRPGSTEDVISRLNAMQLDEIGSWYLKADNADGETLTDVLERKTEQADKLFIVDEADSDEASPEADTDASAQSARVSDELDKKFTQELLRRRRKKRTVWFTIAAILVLAALGALLIYSAGKKGDTPTADAKLSMQLETDGSILLQWEDAGQEARIAVYSAKPVAWTDARPLPEGTADFTDISDGSSVVFPAGNKGELRLNGLVPDCFYHASLLNGENTVAQSEAHTAEVGASQAIQSITHLLYSFPKPSDGEELATHEQLTERWLLDKLESKTELYAGREFYKKNGIYMHLTCKNNVDETTLLVCLKLGNDTYAAYANSENGTAGVFGGNKLFVLLDPVLETVQTASEQNCEIRVYAGDGLIYAFEGKIK